jgi:NitT/TauT family transport system substrate-binding protein
VSPVALSRRTLLGAGVGLAAAGGLFGVADLARSAVTDPAIDGPQLRIGYLPITDAAPLLIAHAAGLYPPGAVSAAKPVLFRSWAALAEAFITRQVDVAHLLMPMAVQLRYTLGSGVRVLGWNHTNGSALTVAPDLKDLGELAGTQVAIPFWWSIHNIVLQQLLRAHGLRPVIRRSASRSQGTVELVVMSPSDMVPALGNRSIGGYVVADPFNAMAQLKGIGRIHTFLGDVWRDHACCVLVTREDVIEGRRNAVQAVTNAVALALTYPSPPYPLRHPDWQPQHLGFKPYPYPSFTQRLVEAMGDTVVDGDRRFLDRIDSASVHGELVDDGFVRTALTGQGGPGTLTRTEQVAPL